MKRTLVGMMVCLPLLLAAGYGCQPGTSTTMDMAAPMPDLAQGALKILSLGTNVNSLTQGGTVRVTAVVTHTDGLQKLLGGEKAVADCFVPHREERWLCDIYALARLQLDALGVTAVYGGGEDTCANWQNFYSFRRDGATGRMVSLVWRMD